MDPTWDRSQGPRPSTASVQVRELSQQGLNNPCPQSKELDSHGDIHREHRVEEYLSPAQLQALAQVDDLQLVRVLEMCVDTRKNSLGNFGVHLPNLIQLKLNHSCLDSLRDLGTSLGHLQVLWLACCGLTDLDGIGSFLALKAPKGYNYRAEVRKLIPQLHILDEVPTTCTNLPVPQKLNQDWLLVKEAIKEDCSHGTTWKLDPTLLVPETQPWALSLLVPEDPLSEGLLSENPATEDHASNLTHGTGQVLCGNPTKGLRERRYQYKEWAPLDQLPIHSPDLATNPSIPRPDPADSCDLAMTGLQAWREPGLCPLLHRQLQQERPAQVSVQDPQKTHEEQEGQAGFKISPSSPSLDSEFSRTSGFRLIPSPPKYPMPPKSGSSFPRRSADLSFRGRRLRVLSSLQPSLGEGPGLSERLATVTALRALEVSSGPNHRVQGCPDANSALGPKAHTSGIHCLHHLNPIPPAHCLP
ncbi:leucine-rich repeat-containing protein 56 isoform X3 [Nannospalax galili]|uniref:leucine-rich repeat-containing protein 56 isoform X3 n=1 Tax=Nannospalax galili TaxID=1026970 RepID=UPI000819E239|nr:leucine-rich repeat-containing protein 56 isoform X3 [Nannospalax galili]